MRREILRAEKAFFLGGNQKKKNRASNFLWMRLQARRDVRDQRAPRAVIHRAVVNAIAVDGRADADVGDVRGKDYKFILESGISAREFGNEVGGFDRLRENLGFGIERNSQGE